MRMRKPLSLNLHLPLISTESLKWITEPDPYARPGKYHVLLHSHPNDVKINETTFNPVNPSPGARSELTSPEGHGLHAEWYILILYYW